MSRTSGAWTLALPADLPRWTVPLVLLATLALEAWDVWHDHPVVVITLDTCVSECLDLGQPFDAWTPQSCACGFETDTRESR